jgi:4a-hydroxytetrahydrobiopterin dehydratase
MDVELRPLSDDEIAAAVAELDGWRHFDNKLCHEYVFANFVDAIAFIDRTAVWAETWNHHPEWSNVYNVVRVELWTHDVGGISALDVQLAHKMNELADQ